MQIHSVMCNKHIKPFISVENCKTLMRGIKEDIKKEILIFISEETSNFPNLIYRFIANLIKIEDLCWNSKGFRIIEIFETETVLKDFYYLILRLAIKPQ